MDKSPASHAGLQPGDVIVGFGPTPVANIDDLHRVLTREAIDRLTELIVVRNGSRVALPITPNEAAA
jgi:S1-C subfamily serine protease